MFFVHGAVQNSNISKCMHQELLFKNSNFHKYLFSRCGFLPMDLILQQYLRKSILNWFYTPDLHNKLDLVEYVRNYFIQPSANDYPVLPYGVMAYICGAKLENRSLCLQLERKWKENRI